MEMLAKFEEGYKEKGCHRFADNTYKYLISTFKRNTYTDLSCNEFYLTLI